VEQDNTVNHNRHMVCMA